MTTPASITDLGAKVTSNRSPADFRLWDLADLRLWSAENLEADLQASQSLAAKKISFLGECSSSQTPPPNPDTLN